MKDDIKNKKITVVGAGVSGKGLAALASGLGAKVFVSEVKKINDETKKFFNENNIEFEDGANTERAFDADIILLSSGIPPKSDFVKEAERRGVKLTGEIDFAAPLLSGKIIGVTGSNGKSTVTSLIGHMLNKAGLKAGTGGNLGISAANFTQAVSHEKFDAVVLELSSFQLARANFLNAFIAIITNLAPDHIDWHGSYENYIAAKANILALRSPDGWGIVQDRDVQDLKKALGIKDNFERVITLSWDKNPVNKLSGHVFMDNDNHAAVLFLNDDEIKLFDFNDTDLLGAHNLENIAMCMAAMKLMNVKNNAAELLNGFKPLPHRCHNAGVINNVLYVDDSKGTNVAATVTAMSSVQGRKVIILGGRGKGEDYAPLAEAVKKYADAAVLIGEEANAINQALVKSGFKNIYMAKNMEDAVKTAHDIAKPEMTVLLSPACTSWDMYDNYNQRGEHFCELVNKLK